jgi:hypothetical protein
MKFWDNFRNYFYNRTLAEKLQNLKTKRIITNLKDAKTIGIIFNSTHPDNDITITKFAENLRSQGKAVDIIGFVNDKQTEQKPGFTIFNKKNLSWTLIPQDESVEKFAEKNFDLLFASFVDEDLSLEYVARISKAKWKAGIYRANKVDFYDIMINLGGRNELPYFLEQATHFLNEIKYDSY